MDHAQIMDIKKVAKGNKSYYGIYLVNTIYSLPGYFDFFI